MATKEASVHPTTLGQLDSPQSHAFEKPSKRINEGEDVTHFLTSKAYTDIMTFILQLNISMFPRNQDDQKKEEDTPAIQNLENLLDLLQVAVQEVPPDPGPRRFGNLAFRKWFSLVESQSREKVAALVPNLPATAVDEIQAYLLGGFGSAQRLDYGTGHELSFLAFLGCLWKVGYFSASNNHNLERQIVLEVFKPYLELVRRLILTYNLEPAGSHGVWGLDDHAFLPYIFGSAELSPTLGPGLKIPAEGSAQGAPNPADVTKSTVVERERAGNLYFGAIGFINDVKKGPFWEHSPMLYDISGVQAGWAKINKGMIKMYNAEVLSKFPVVQHFPFGSLFRWEADPTAVAPTTSTHVSSQPTFASQTSSRTHAPARAPLSGTTAAPWADSPSARTTEPGLSRPDLNKNARAPWAAGNSAPQSASSASLNPSMAPTRAPWAKK